jgi:exodeoxyribonuclease VII small subunit
MAQMAQGMPTYEESITQLNKIVESIEQGKIGLEDSIKQFEEGMALIRQCRKVLTEAEMKIQHLQAQGADGVIAAPAQDNQKH